MVKVGFIVEGSCERIILRANVFQTYWQQIGIEQIGDIVNMDGKGNLRQSSTRMGNQVKSLRQQGAECIVILRDYDGANTFQTVYQEVFQASDCKACFAVQELEAWFLADSAALSVYLGTTFHHNSPETVLKPFIELSILRHQYLKRGISDKKLLANHMLASGFTIEKAARHPNCPSAQYFLSTLQTLASAN